ncbi:MAG: NADH-quinone oxidoreductase subunit N [Chloroflexi bacterium]|nr:NADH-quinone oxidoreductase subunit N [Chloroflexota bacterium]
MSDVVAVLPEAIVAATAIFVLAFAATLGDERARPWVPWLTLLGLIAALAAPLAYPFTGLAFRGFVLVDQFSAFFRLVFVVLAAFTVVVAPSYLRRERVPEAEFYATVLFSTVGAMTIALSTDLITLFVGIELMSIPVYVLAGLQRRDRYANEAALKYFLLGAFSSAILVYGFAWLFGIAGTTDLAQIATAVGRAGLGSPEVVIALALVTAGLGFKAAVVPFHQWTPDAYDGAPTPSTAFMSVAPKAAAFAAILRVMATALGPAQADWGVVFAVLAAVTMTAGNVVALAQTNVKRMLAYSSIAHTGYILAGVAALDAGTSAGAAVLFYLFAYGVMNLGAFACLMLLDLEGTRGATLEELNGLWSRHPAGALAFTVFLVNLTGIPPTIGFLGKFLMIQPVLDAGLGWLAVAIALNAVLAAFYYLRVVVHMFMYDPDAKGPRVVPARLLSVSLVVVALVTILLGVLPDPIHAFALRAAEPVVIR